MKLDFDIDTYLNPFVPAPWLHTLPHWLSWCLGYRRKAGRKISTAEVWLWTFIGAFCGVSVVQAVFERSEYFLERGVVNIVGAFVHIPNISSPGLAFHVQKNCPLHPIRDLFLLSIHVVID